MTATELAALGIGGYSYWAAILPEGSTKAFAEKKVRQLEAKLELERGVMDRPGADLRSKLKIWNLPRVDIDRYNLLSVEGKAAAQSAFRAAIEEELKQDQELTLRANGTDS